MVYRIRFAKYGIVRYIGHLDVMRYFQKVVRRSDLPVKYSQGFTPHQIMSFALPLGLGITSDGEYMEIEFDDSVTAEEIMTALRAHTTEGFEVLDICELPKPLPNTHVDSAMALVSGAEYMISCKDGYTLPFSSEEELWSCFKDFYAQESIVINKKTKKSNEETDIKPFIYKAYPTVDVAFDKGVLLGNDEITRSFGIADNTAHAEKFENGLTLHMCLSAGSKMNVRPEPVIEALCGFAGAEYNPYAFACHRMELYMGDKDLRGLTYKGEINGQ